MKTAEKEFTVQRKAKEIPEMASRVQPVYSQTCYLSLCSSKEFLVLGTRVGKRVPRLVQRIAAFVFLAHAIDDKHEDKYDQQQYQYQTSDERCTHGQTTLLSDYTAITYSA